MNPRVAVISAEGVRLMPTKASRARRMRDKGEAVGKWNDAGVYYIQLTKSPSGTDTQDIHAGADPGKAYSGIALQSAKETLYKSHLVLPFRRVKERMGSPVIKKGKVIKGPRGRALQRRVRRGRRINRKVAFSLRAHRQKRFSNRRKSKLAPSIKASRQMEIRVLTELAKIYPITSIVYEVIKADVDLTSGRKGAKSGEGFSPVMVGQYWCIEQLKAIAPVVTRYGWETARIRERLGLVKCKDKKAQVPEAHAVDGVALAASQFVRYKYVQSADEHGHEWHGSVDVTPSVFRVITRPNYFRRALHFDNAAKGGVRKRKGGTVTPFGYRSGDKVQVRTKGQVLTGWVGGFTDADKKKAVSVYDVNWKRLGQYGLKQISMIRRSNKLCVV